MSERPPNRSHPPFEAPASDDRNWGVVAHLSALVMLVGVPSAIGPLIVWLVKRDHAFVEEHAREALNFNISFLIYALALALLAFVTLGIGLLVAVPAGIVLLVLWIIGLVQGAIAASRGEAYRYPLTLRLIT